MSLAITATSQKAPPTPPSEADGAPLNLIMIRQDPLSLTLGAFSLLTLSVTLVFGLYFIDRPVLALLILLIPASILIRNDYINFLRLGPGGTPSTPAGYARLTFLRLFTLRDPFAPPPLPPKASTPPLHPAHGILHNLPYRPGPRPIVAGLAPQRQLTQHAPLPVYSRLRASLGALAARSPAQFVTATSSLEKHGLALFARHPASPPYRHANGEVCHVHASTDRSLHLSLHPADIRELLEKGWGERHPLALADDGEGSRWGKGWEVLVRMGVVRSPVPWTLCLVYAPRDESDLRIVCKIIEAAVWYTTAERVEIEPATD